jgi:hypothetical protein
MKEYRNEKGELHWEDGPVVIFNNGVREWFVNGKLHRDDGPAVESSDGTKIWYCNGLLHRLDGPAVIYNGRKEWWINGKRHRLDGPAEEYVYMNNGWWINDKEYSYDQFQQLTYFPKEKYSTNEADITYIRLEDNLGVRISLYTELWIDGVYRIIEDQTLDQLVRGIDKDNFVINPLHDYILENLT